MKTCNGCRTKKGTKSIFFAGTMGVLVGVAIGYLMCNIK